MWAPRIPVPEVLTGLYNRVPLVDWALLQAKALPGDWWKPGGWFLNTCARAQGAFRAFGVGLVAIWIVSGVLVWCVSAFGRFGWCR